MPKIIVKIKHVKGKSSSGGLVNYIANRDGVDKSVNLKMFPGKATKKQTEYIEEMIKKCPDAKNSFEYMDYIDSPTFKNASELISIVSENNPQIFENRETYLNYIATRPGVEKKNVHGLFGMENDIDLKAVRDEVSEYSGTIWTPIISLTGEDAARLGYDNAAAWQALIRAKQSELADIFGIPVSQFNWYGAFHNTGTHPHVHMIVYSADARSRYITESDIEKVKSLFAKEIFKDDMYEIYSKKTKMRDRISDEVKLDLKDITSKIKENNYADSELCQMLFDFSRKLEGVKGKKVYGYLPKELKNDVDKIVIVMSRDENIKELYERWCEIQKELYGIYKDYDVDFPPLWNNKEFKKIKNAVVKEAEKLINDRNFYDEDEIENEVLTENHENDTKDENENAEHGELALSAMNLMYRLARLIEGDADKKIDGFNKTIVDSKEQIEEMKKKQRLGIKMG